MLDVQHRGDRLPLKEWVLGTDVDGSSKADPFSILAMANRDRGELRTPRRQRQELQDHP